MDEVKGKAEGQNPKELAELRRRVAELESTKSELLQAEEELRGHREHLEELVEERTAELKKINTRLKREIKERKRKEAELERSEKYFQALIDNTYDIIAVLDADGSMRYLSSSLERVSGFTQDERTGKKAFEFFHPEDLPGVAEAFARGIQQPGFTDMLEYRWQHKDGTWHYQEAIATNLLDDPYVRGIVVNSRDITDRKRAEQALRESEERYRSLVETSPDCIILSDLNGKILMVNRSGAVLFGYQKVEELVGKSVIELIAPEDTQRAMNSMRTRPETGLARSEEYAMVRKDGTRFFVEISASLLRNAEGKPLGFIGIARDITGRKRAEERLQKLNRCFLSLGTDPLENIQKIALTGGEILEADLVRYGRMEKGSFDIFSSMQADKGFMPLEKVEDYLCYQLLSSGALRPLTYEDLDKELFERDPDVRAYGLRSCLIHPINMRGEPTGCFCLFTRESRTFNRVETDILAMLGRAISIEEERWAFEENLRDFADIASHELRHPVALVTGFAETLEEHGADLDEETRREVINAIKQSAERLNRMVTGLLNLSLVERERFFFAKRGEDLGSLIELVVKEMKVKAPGRGFTVSMAGDTGECQVDPERFHDLMVILLDNAVKYSPEDTEIEVTVEPAAGEILISVLDRGVGVPEEHRERIFKRFHQVEEAQFHSKPGLGLGLFLAREIVKAHGGRIWYEPREGGGSVFRFTLPA